MVFCDCNEDAGQSVAKDLNATFIKADVTDATQVESFFDQVLDNFACGTVRGRSTVQTAHVYFR